MAGRGVNKAIIVGNLGGDPDMRYTASGNPIAKANVATTATWRDKEGNQQERTEWHRVIFFGGLAKIVGEYLHKGSHVFVEGSLRTNKWTDNNGADHYTTEIIANEMVMLGNRDRYGGGQGSSSQRNENYGDSGGGRGAPKQREQLSNSVGHSESTNESSSGSGSTNESSSGSGSTDEFEDDIPF
ncbi:MAG: single-stranded DNA-binding protein [Candidatus Eutrophobiaceae bacterium]